MLPGIFAQYNTPGLEYSLEGDKISNVKIGNFEIDYFYEEGLLDKSVIKEFDLEGNIQKEYVYEYGHNSAGETNSLSINGEVIESSQYNEDFELFEYSDGFQTYYVNVEEDCNQVDDNSNGLIDEGCDDDSDGYVDLSLGCYDGFIGGDSVILNNDFSEKILSLKSGWNVVSFPISSELSVSEFYEKSNCEHSGAEASALKWENDGTGRERFSSVSSFEAGTGYYIEVLNDCEFDLTEYGLVSKSSFELQQGWNLVGGTSEDLRETFPKVTDGDNLLYFDGASNNVARGKGSALKAYWVLLREEETLLSCGRVDFCDNDASASRYEDCIGAREFSLDSSAEIFFSGENIPTEGPVSFSRAGRYLVRLPTTLPSALDHSVYVIGENEIEEVTLEFEGREYVGIAQNMTNLLGAHSDRYDFELEIFGPPEELFSSEENSLNMRYDVVATAREVSGAVASRGGESSSIRWEYEPVLWSERKAALQECEGCLFGDGCVPATFRAEGNLSPIYCSSQGEIDYQKEAGSSCLEDYQCLTNRCISGGCVDLRDVLGIEEAGLLKRLVCRLTNIGEDYEECLLE